MGHGKERGTPHLAADADVMARRLWDALQTGDVIVCLKIWWVGNEGGGGGMNVFKRRQTMTRSVRRYCHPYHVFPVDTVVQQSHLVQSTENRIKLQTTDMDITASAAKRSEDIGSQYPLAKVTLSMQNVRAGR